MQAPISEAELPENQRSLPLPTEHIQPRPRVSAGLQRALTLLRRDALALLVFALLGLLIMAPVLEHFATRTLGHRGDNLAYVYMAGWVAEALANGQSPFVDPRLNVPEGLNLASTELPYLPLLAVAPATWLAGPTAGYNLALLLAHLLSGYCTYLWVRSATGSRSGGIVAGMAFMLAPFRIARSFGHLTLASTYPLPLFFWALDHTLGPVPPKRGRLMLLAGAALLVAGTSQYNALICLITGSVYALLALRGRWAFVLRYGWQVAAVTAGGTLAGLLPSLLVLARGELHAYNIEATRIWSASPLNFLAPSPFHPLWGEWIARARPETLWIEKALYLGAVAGLLALVALVWRNNPVRSLCLTWAGVAVAGVVFALGTDLHFGNLPLNAEQPFWLPMYYLGQLPLFNLARTWSRFGVIAVLFVALLAGVGAARLARGRWRQLVGLALMLLVLVDLLPGTLPAVAIEPRPIDRWLAAQPGPFRVGFLPVIHGTPSYGVAYGSLVHNQQTFAAMHNQHPGAVFVDYERRSEGFPNPQSLQALRALGLRYLVLERALFGEAWPAVEAAVRVAPELAVVAELEDSLVVAFR